MLTPIDVLNTVRKELAEMKQAAIDAALIHFRRMEAREALIYLIGKDPDNEASYREALSALTPHL